MRSCQPKTNPARPAAALLTILLLAAASGARGQGVVATGTYVGDGTAAQAIAGAGFAPDVVIVKSTLARPARCRTATMATGMSKSLGGPAAVDDQGIVSLDADGFTVGPDASVNEAGVPYTWVALKAGAGLIQLGSYVGNGANFRLISGLAFTPAAILVLGEGGQDAVFRSGTMAVGKSLALADGTVHADAVFNGTNGGFHVGGADEVNAGGTVYHYLVLNDAEGLIATGSYTGDGTGGREVADAGLEPAWLLLTSLDVPSAVHRQVAGGDATQFFAAEADAGGLVTGLTATGFTLGEAPQANAPAAAYDWLAIGAAGDLVDLGLAAAAAPATAAVADTVRFAFALTNQSALDATGVAVATTFAPGLEVAGHELDAGAWSAATGSWSVGTLAAGATATLTVTTVVQPGQEGRELAGSAAITANDQPDPDPEDDAASAFVTVSVSDAGGVRVLALSGDPVGARPGDGPRTVLSLLLVNVGDRPDTLRALRVANLTAGAGDTADLDAEWSPLELTVAPPGGGGALASGLAGFAGGSADVIGLVAAFAPRATRRVGVAGAPSLVVRDGAGLAVGVPDETGIAVASTLYGDGAWPLTGGHALVVDGFVTAQATLHEVPPALLAVGSTDNLAFDVSLPGNGYLDDSLYGFNVVNLGSAEPGTDIAALKAWLDDGDGAFSPVLDVLLGRLVNSGARWQLTGLAAPVPAGGARVFLSADIAETAQPAREIRLGLPVEHGPGVEMASGNDGPVDGSLANAAALGISTADRVILTAGSIAPATVAPGSRGVPLLDVLLTNTYADDRSLQSLIVTNATLGAPGATTAQLDGILRQVNLRLDGDDDGDLDDPVTDPAIGTGAFQDGRVVFQGLDLALPAGDSRRLFVAGDVSLTGAAEGDRLAAVVTQGGDVLIGNTSIVADWPLDSGASWRVDGMVRDQLALRPIPVQSLGPDAVRNLALDLHVPPNGYQDDEFLGLTVRNEGTAGPDDLARLELWHDGGNGFFDAGTLDDVLAGELGRANGRWVSSLLDVPVGREGLRVYVSVDVAADPADSTTVRLAVPLGGVVNASGNSGPLDRECVETGSLVLSTSPLHSTVVFTAPASTVGQAGQIRMTVRNEGVEPVTGVTPSILDRDGEGALDLGPPTPASQDVGVGQEALFTWPFTATGAGGVVLAANAAGVGTGGETFAAGPTPTPEHTVYTPATELDLYPVTSMPSTVNLGQTGLVPLTLTFINPGDATVADGLLTRLRLRLSETAGGPGIVPAELLSRVVVSEGTNVYATVAALPDTGSEVEIPMDPPVVVTGSEPVSLGVRLDVRFDTTASSFVLSIEDATSLAAADAVSGAAVPVVLADDAYPVRTGQANLVSPAGSLVVSLPPAAARAASPGQAEVPAATFALTNTGADRSSSAISVSQLAFVLADTLGRTIRAPAGRFDRVTLRTAYQEHFRGAPLVLGDTLLVLPLSAPAIVASEATVTADLVVDLAADAPLGAWRAVLADAEHVAATDANTGEPVPVLTGPAREGPWAGVYTPMLGYWNRPEETAKALAGGVLHTGDVGVLEPDGTLYIRGRRSDLILRGGANVYPAEVERVLAEHPAVAEVAVLGLPDARRGERVAVVVPAAEGAPTQDALRAWCLERLARYKVPERIALAAELPRNAMSKVLKRELRPLFGGGADGESG